MPLRPADTLMPPERILSFGGSGVGKTRDLFDIARLAAQTQSDAKFFFVDTDNTAEAMLMRGFRDVADRVTRRFTPEWDDLIDTVREFQGKMTINDWLVVDLLSPAWDMCQSRYVEKVFGKTMDDYFIEVRKANAARGANAKDERPFEKDWQVIANMYKVLPSMLLRNPGHLYCTASTANIAKDTEQAIRRDFATIGYVPRGQKQTPHLFHTVLYKQSFKPGEWAMSTVKDRERPYMDAVPVQNFAVQYLCKVANWALV